MNHVTPPCWIAAECFDDDSDRAGYVVPEFEKGLCQERKSDFIPLDNIYGYPLYSEGFSLCRRALEGVPW